MQIKLLIEGGDMKPGPALSQKLGPVGIPINQVIQKVNEATKNFKGLKVPVELEIDSGTKDIEVNVFSPPVAELLKKELGIEKGSGIQHKQYAGNASIEQIISVAKTKLPNMLCKDLKTAVKTVIGTCVSLGILVESQLASELGHQIDGGKFSKEINSETTLTPPEKLKKLKEYFDEVREKQEQAIKLELAAKEAAAATPEAEKTEPGAETPETATTAKTAETPKKEAGKVSSAKTPAKEDKKKK